jgi:hypothetical protein
MKFFEARHGNSLFQERAPALQGTLLLLIF